MLITLKMYLKMTQNLNLLLILKLEMNHLLVLMDLRVLIPQEYKRKKQAYMTRTIQKRFMIVIQVIFSWILRMKIMII